MSLGDLLIAACGFAVSSLCVFYALALVFWLLRAWPIGKLRTQPQSRMQGGCAKHDWSGNWP